jgi:hypothetical protein
MRIFFSLLTSLTYIAAAPQTPAEASVDSIWAGYVKAVGGQPAADRFTSRETVVNVHRGPDITLYWLAPNKVLSIGKKERTGCDGTHCWELSSKSKIRKLVRGAELPIEMEANPLRFIHLKDLYPELNTAAAEEIDGEKMNVLMAPNNLGATKLYFDAATHLLRRVEVKGEVSAYFTNTVDYLDYREVDGVLLPFHILHSTTEPEGHSEDLRIKKIAHNVKLQPEMFDKPIPGQVVLGGKR